MKHEYCMMPVMSGYDPGELWTLKKDTPVPSKHFETMTHHLKTFEDANGNTRTVLELATVSLFSEPVGGVLNFK